MCHDSSSNHRFHLIYLTFHLRIPFLSYPWAIDIAKGGYLSLLSCSHMHDLALPLPAATAGMEVRRLSHFQPRHDSSCQIMK
jgi:hypothetical protein